MSANMKTMSQNAVLFKQVAKRKSFILKVISFTEKILSEIGQVVKYTEFSDHTHVIRNLDNFGGFSFHSDTGQTMFGGNEISIHHRSGPQGQVTNLRVLVVRWQPCIFHIDDCNVLDFNEDNEWQETLVRLIRKKRAILLTAEKRKETLLKREMKAVEEVKKLLHLQNDAERLKI